MKNSQKRFTAAWLVVIIIVVLLAVGGYYVYHQSNISTPLDTSEWKQYSNMDLGLAIKYPPLHDPVSANQPRETIHEDPQEVAAAPGGQIDNLSSLLLR